MMYVAHNISPMISVTQSSGYIVKRQRPLGGGMVDCLFANANILSNFQAA